MLKISTIREKFFLTHRELGTENRELGDESWEMGDGSFKKQRKKNTLTTHLRAQRNQTLSNPKTLVEMNVPQSTQTLLPYCSDFIQMFINKVIRYVFR